MRRDNPHPTPDTGLTSDADNLNTYLDAVVTHRPVSSHDLDPELASTAHQFHTLPTPPTDLALRRQIWEDLIASQARPAPVTTPPTIPASWPRPRPQPITVARPVLSPSAVPHHQSTQPTRRDTGSFATAAFLLILVTAISTGVLVLGRGGGDQPTSLPAGIAATAQPTPVRYIGHAARLTAEIPGDWRVDPTGRFDYSGPGGFVVSEPITGRSVEDACATLAASQRFDSPASINPASWNGSDACRMTGHIDGAEALALVVPHPYPFDLWANRYAYAAIITAPDDLDAIAASLDFSPDAVTPEAYARSLLDLVEARSYWSNAVDWPTVRAQVLDFVAGLDTVEMARQGILNLITTNLRLVGDNRSSVQLASALYTQAETAGFGAVFGGSQVLLVYPDSPAARVGLRPGDIIESLDGDPFTPTDHPVDRLTVSTFVSDAAEQASRSITLTVRRPGVAEPITIPLEYGPYTRYAPPTGRRLPGDMGYLALPAFYAPGQEIAYATAADDVVTTVNAPPTCGWIVDLRLTGGAPYSLTLGAIGSIVDNGLIVGWQDRDGGQSWTASLDGRLVYDRPAEFADDANALRRPSPPVAVLIGPQTAGGGEAAALAFVGSATARLFGEPTAGITTISQTYALFDGTILNLSTAAMTDRTGATHPTGLQPDTLIATDWTTFGTDADPVLVAAQAWLDQQPGCAGAPGTPSS